MLRLFLVANFVLHLLLSCLMVKLASMHVYLIFFFHKHLQGTTTSWTWLDFAMISLIRCVAVILLGGTCQYYRLIILPHVCWINLFCISVIAVQLWPGGSLLHHNLWIRLGDRLSIYVLGALARKVRLSDCLRVLFSSSTFTLVLVSHRVRLELSRMGHNTIVHWCWFRL